MSNRYGYGGTIRNVDGDVLLAYNGSEGKKTVIEQQLLGILRGIQGCRLIEERKVEVAADSLRAIHIIKEEERCPWHCRNILAAIKIV
ncbi:hypothetical protein ACHQM5_021126 [Ranunculus cassubicifolius]